MKYSAEPYSLSASERQNLIHKRETFVKETETNKAVQIVLVCANGLVNNGNSDIVQNVLIKNDLFII